MQSNLALKIGGAYLIAFIVGCFFVPPLMSLRILFGISVAGLFFWVIGGIILDLKNSD